MQSGCLNEILQKNSLRIPEFSKYFCSKFQIRLNNFLMHFEINWSVVSNANKMLYVKLIKEFYETNG